MTPAAVDVLLGTSLAAGLVLGAVVSLVNSWRA